jgi:tetratricopeptide (TPR) repeat protein
MNASTDADKRNHYRVWHAYLRYEYARQTEGFNDLNELAKHNDTRSDACFYLGLLYERLKEFDKAIDSYRTASETAPPGIKASRIVSLAEAYGSAGQRISAISTLCTALPTFSSATDLSIIYRGLASIFADKADVELRALALELALENDPQDKDLRFKVAFAYSSNDLRDLALFHYSALLSVDSNNVMALNNIGVEYQNLGMTLNAVRHYRRAFDQKETLAGANLAYLLMNAGFYKEARETLDEAKSVKEPHPNVGSAIAALAQKNDGETENAKRILDRAVAEQKFMKAFARLRFTIASDTFAGLWTAPDGQTFEIVRVGERLSATWKVGKNKHDLSGTVAGQTAKIAYSVNPEGFTIVGYRNVKGYAYLANNGQQLRWMVFDSGVPEFAQFNRVPVT